MRAKTIWRAGLMAVILAFAPAAAMAQDSTGYAPPDTIIPWPLGSNHPEDGGFFTGMDFIFYRQTVPLGNEVVGVRGFYNINNQNAAGQSANFIGSGTVALDTNQVRGPGTYDPGFNAHLGYKFDDGSTVTLTWMYLFQNRFQAVATAAAPNLGVRQDFADSFISAPVFNFPNSLAGLPEQANGPIGPNGLPTATYGIWDGASLMTENFVQRTSSYDLIWRKPIWETENYRFSSLLGPRYFWIWETFRWDTTNFGFTGSGGPTAVYSNSVSNEMYGFEVGCSQEWYIGHGFACQLDLDAVGYVDFVRTEAKYAGQGIDLTTAQNKRSRREYDPVPEFDAKVSVSWYPTEAVQFNFGYNFMSFFNTVTSEEPIDFNYSSLTPSYNHNFIRTFDGLSASVIIVF
jgi:Legionella pneumophila major outer membrane protein precursor